MKFLILLLLIVPLLTACKDPLKGKTFTSCDSSDDWVDQEYSVKYLPNNLEFEGIVFTTKTKEKCQGAIVFAIGRIWKYEIKEEKLITTLDQVSLTIYDPDIMFKFNRIRQCSYNDWKIGDIIACTGLDVLDPEMVKGKKTTHTFELKGDLFKVTDSDGDVRELKLSRE